MPHLVDRDGALYVQEDYRWSSKPTIQRNLYPTGLRTHAFIRDYGRDLPLEIYQDGTTGGRYYFGSSFAPVYIVLAEGGNTRAEVIENIPIPCPKVRKGIETRWSNSRWEKYLKSQGWTSA